MRDAFGEYKIIEGASLNCCPDCGAPVECRVHYSVDLKRFTYAIICTKECSCSRTSYDTYQKAARAHNKRVNPFEIQAENAKLKRENARLRKQLKAAIDARVEK